VADWTHWSPAEIDTLRTKHADGATFVEISKALPGRSKAACISKAHKLGIYGHDGPAKRRRQAERLRAQRAFLGGLHA
jgi:hypothetical protein